MSPNWIFRSIIYNTTLNTMPKKNTTPSFYKPKFSFILLELQAYVYVHTNSSTNQQMASRILCLGYEVKLRILRICSIYIAE